MSNARRVQKASNSLLLVASNLLAINRDAGRFGRRGCRGRGSRLDAIGAAATMAAEALDGNPALDLPEGTLARCPRE
jgi:hypothetical protein